MSPFLLLVFALAASGATCGQASTAPDRPQAALQESARWTPPFVASLEGPKAPRPGELVRLRLTVVRHLVDATPMAISLSLPDGVELAEGQLEEKVVDAASATLVREYALRLGPEIPRERVVVKVEQEGEGWGARAEKAYAFGAPDPRDLQAPLRYGEPVEVGGHRIRPVKLDE